MNTLYYLLAGIATVAFCAGVYKRAEWIKQRAVKEALDAAWEGNYMAGVEAGEVAGEQKLRADYLEHYPDTRYEISFYDWGLTHTEMRWRWMVKNADIFMKSKADARTYYPLMLGNAPSRAMAEAEALAWVAAQRVESVVV